MPEWSICVACSEPRYDTQRYEERGVLCSECVRLLRNVVTFEVSKPNPAHQMSLTGDGEGNLEPAFDSTETDLTDYGATVDYDEKETKIDRPSASGFGVDDRIETRSSESKSSEQQNLVPDPDQHRLGDSGDT